MATAKLIISEIFQFYWCYDLSIDILSGSGCKFALRLVSRNSSREPDKWHTSWQDIRPTTEIRTGHLQSAFRTLTPWENVRCGKSFFRNWYSKCLPELSPTWTCESSVQPKVSNLLPSLDSRAKTRWMKWEYRSTGGEGTVIEPERWVRYTFPYD